MPLLDFDPAAGTIAQRCAVCAAEHVHDVATLRLGADQDPNVVVLPACACRAHEVLVRTWDRCPPAFRGSAFDVQRRRINALAQHLRDAGQVHPAQRSVIEAEASAPPDMP